MENKVCIACKQPIDDAVAVETSKGGWVHYGQCLNYVEGLSMSESEQEDVLQETQLLI